MAAADGHDHIRWLGTIPYREVGAVIAGSLAALVPTTDLGGARVAPSPVKLYEAMASGVPVVASDIEGVGEIVRANDCGLVFASGDAPALAGCVADLDRDPRRAAEMGARGRAAAVERYSWDVRAAQTEAVIEQTPSGEAPARLASSLREHRAVHGFMLADDRSDVETLDHLAPGRGRPFAEPRCDRRSTDPSPSPGREGRRPARGSRDQVRRARHCPERSTR